MQDNLGKADIPFVAYDGPKLPQDPNLRRLIRRQAMKKAAAARKQRGGYGQQNLRQVPVFLEETSQIEESSRPLKIRSTDMIACRGQDGAKSDRDHIQDLELWFQHTITPRPHVHASLGPMVRASKLSVAEQLSLLLSLMPLTELRLGIANVSQLKTVPDRTEDLCSPSHAGKRRLLYYIPSRYGYVPSLSHATDCVIAKLWQIIQPSKSRHADEINILTHYTKALEALQAALEDENQRFTAETLCTAELLGIFELLNGNSEPHSWLRHAGGAAQLIQTRGAHRFNTEFEMALFTAQIGPAVMDAFLNNKPCFLAEDKWKQVMLLAIRRDESFTEQWDLAIGLWGHLVGGPRKFKEVTDLILSPMQPRQDIVNELIVDILEERDALARWMRRAQKQPHDSLNEELEQCKYGALFPRPPVKGGVLSSKYATKLALWGTYVLCRILKGRLLSTLSPYRFRHIESECQYLASRIMNLRQGLPENEGGRLLETLFISQIRWMAKGIVETKIIWGEVRDDKEAMIDKWKFEAWCRAIGREVPIKCI